MRVALLFPPAATRRFQREGIFQEPDAPEGYHPSAQAKRGRWGYRRGSAAATRRGFLKKGPKGAFLCVKDRYPYGPKPALRGVRWSLASNCEPSGIEPGCAGNGAARPRSSLKQLYFLLLDRNRYRYKLLINN